MKFLLFEISIFVYLLQLDKMENAEDVKTIVELYIYDLTKGLASMMSRLVIGKLKYMYIIQLCVMHGALISKNDERLSRKVRIISFVHSI